MKNLNKVGAFLGIISTSVNITAAFYLLYCDMGSSACLLVNNLLFWPWLSISFIEKIFLNMPSVALAFLVFSVLNVILLYCIGLLLTPVFEKIKETYRDRKLYFVRICSNILLLVSALYLFFKNLRVVILNYNIHFGPEFNNCGYKGAVIQALIYFFFSIISISFIYCFKKNNKKNIAVIIADIVGLLIIFAFLRSDLCIL